MTTFLSLMQRSIKFKDEAEIVVGFDGDDENTIECIPMWEKLFPDLDIRWVEFEQSDHLNSYYNMLAELSTGEYLCICNDDTEYMTPKWDEIIYEKTDDVRYLRGDEGTKFACFPILTRKAYEALGYVFHPKYYNWTADMALYDAFNSVGKVFNVPIEILHNSYHESRRVRDDINYKVRFKATNEVDKTREILKEYIDGH